MTKKTDKKLVTKNASGGGQSNLVSNVKVKSCQKPKTKSHSITMPVRKMPARRCKPGWTPETSVEERVFQISVIMRLILSHFDLATLKLCRLVNASWLQSASTEMRLRPSSQVHFEYNMYTKSYFTDNNDPNTISTSLNAFNRCLSKSSIQNFPCQNFIFYACFDLGVEDVESFFTKFKPGLIRSLSLDNLGENKTSKILFQRLLTSFNLYNLEKLRLSGDFDYDWDDDDGTRGEQLKLPCLKEFTCEKFKPVSSTAKRIICGAGQLQNIKNFVLTDTPWFIRHNKIGAVRSFQSPWRFWRDGNGPWILDNFVKFSSIPPRLYKLHLTIDHDYSLLKEKGFEENREKILKSFIKILNSSHETLVTLELEKFPWSSSSNHELSPRMEIPRLKNLRKLILSNFDTNFEKDEEKQEKNWTLFPPGCPLTWTFPKVEILTFQFHHQDDGEIFCHLLDNIVGDLKLVKTVKFQSCPLNPQFMARVHEICPNFRVCTIRHNSGNVDSSVGQCVALVCEFWQHLENLEFDIRFTPNCVPNFDWAINGFSKKMTKQLLSKMMTMRPQKIKDELKNLRQRSWLGSIAGLQKFKITFGNFFPKRTKGHQIPLTQLSGHFAFDLLPDLQVTIGYDHHRSSVEDFKKDFKALEPWVNFVHCRYR